MDAEFAVDVVGEFESLTVWHGIAEQNCGIFDGWVFFSGIEADHMGLAIADAVF